MAWSGACGRPSSKPCFSTRETTRGGESLCSVRPTGQQLTSFFYAPVVRWWSRWLAARAELRADRAAIEMGGRGPGAAAFLALGSHGRPSGAAAFASTAQLRIAQVLGDPLPAQAPELSVLAITWVGVYLAFVSAGCLVQILLSLAR